jgi:hypothetical protein
MLKIKKEKIPLILIISSVVFAAVSFSFIPFTGGDNFAYFYLARAIAQGKGYIELWDPALPLHTQYPPCFPILLLPAALFDSYLLAKITVFLCYVLSLFFSFRLYQELNGQKSEDSTLVALLLIAITPAILEYSSWVLSETPYILFSILSLYFWSRKRYKISLLFATITFLTRTAGITLLLTVSVFYFLKFKEDKKKIVLPSIALLSIILWIGYTQHFITPDKESYFQQLLAKNPYDPTSGNINALDLLIRAGKNIWAMPVKVFAQIKSTSLSLFIGLTLLGFLILGVFGNKISSKKTAKKNDNSIFSTINLINVYLLLYLLTVWTWPYIWAADKRFYLPVLPLIAFWLGKGLTEAFKKLPKNIDNRFFNFIIPGILAIHCIFISLTSSTKKWNDNVKWIKYSIPSKEATYFESYINIKKWASNENIPDNSVFIARKRQAFYHFTKFQAARVPRTQNPQELKDIIENNKVNFITVTVFFNSRFILLNSMNLLKDEYEFIPVYMTPERTAAVFKYNKKNNIK